jgi:hypothetical protein
MTRQSNSSSFGQADPTDGRKPFEWQSKYNDSAAIRKQVCEAIYLGTLLFLTPLIMVVLWLELPKYWFHLPDAKYAPILKYGFAWASGTLGGVLFDLKWLYHTVARGMWHLDRRLWRVFTPHISGGLSFCVVALVSSGALRIFDSKAMNSCASIVGIGFLAGYFSDSAIAKLTEVAETLFGTTRSKEKQKDQSNSLPPDDPQSANAGGA